MFAPLSGPGRAHLIGLPSYFDRCLDPVGHRRAKLLAGCYPRPHSLDNFELGKRGATADVVVRWCDGGDGHGGCGRLNGQRSHGKFERAGARESSQLTQRLARARPANRDHEEWQKKKKKTDDQC